MHHPAQSATPHTPSVAAPSLCANPPSPTDTIQEGSGSGVPSGSWLVQGDRGASGSVGSSALLSASGAGKCSACPRTLLLCRDATLVRPSVSLRGGKGKKRVHNTNRNERSRGRSLLHGHGTFSTSKAGSWWLAVVAVGGWCSLGAVLPVTSLTVLCALHNATCAPLGQSRST